MAIGKRAARLTGLQQYKRMAESIECVDGDAAEAARFLTIAFSGMGDETSLELSPDGQNATVHHHGLRIVRDITGDERDTLLECWIELWRGAVSSHRTFIDVVLEDLGQELVWSLSPSATA